MIQEYYLHLLCGSNGEQDHYTGAGRLAIAALMSGFGLTASTKKDLQARVGWTTTPGCFLGQKEILDTDYHIRNYPESIFTMKLMRFRKVNRTMNYQLDWSILDEESVDWTATSPMWINLAKIYWLGFFLFGRNVIPDYVIEKLRTRWRPDVHPQVNMHQVLKSHFIMQFLKNIGIDFTRLRTPHIFSVSSDDLSRTQIFFSLAVAMNWADNTAGFYATASLLGDFVPQGARLDEVAPHFAEYIASRPGRFGGNYMPLTQAYYYTYGIGRPQLPSTPGRMSAYGRDIVPLLFCDSTRTPQQEASSNYAQVRGEGFNVEYLTYNLQTWMTAAILWEYYLFLTGRELFPLTALIEARTENGWTEDLILDRVVNLTPANQKNCSVGQMVRFNLQRQSQV